MGRQGGRRNSSLRDHKRHKKTLTPPLLQMPNQVPVDWPLLQPDMLWLASLQLEHPHDVGVAGRALDVLDRYAPKPDHENGVVDGRLTAFELLPEANRADARVEVRRVVPEAFSVELGLALELFPSAPARWLCCGSPPERTGEPEAGLDYLRRLLAELADSRATFSIHARMLSLNRYFVHGRVFFGPNISTASLLPLYPSGLTDEEAAQVRQFCRGLYDSTIMSQRSDSEQQWGARFWVDCGKLAAGPSV